MVVEVVFEKGILRPLEPLEGLKEGDRLDVEIIPGGIHWKGALKDLKLTSVELQHEIKKHWSNKHVSD